MRADNGTPETIVICKSYQPGMVDMGMGENDVINRVGIEAQVAVHGICFEAFALEHAAIEQDLLASCSGDEVFAACYFAGRAEEFDFHKSESLSCLKILVIE